jgi:hypothetical protein
MKGYSPPRPSLAPPAPPVSEAPPPPTTHELFDVVSAEPDIARNAMVRRAEQRASARPRPPRPGSKPDPTPTEAVEVKSKAASDDSAGKLSTPLSWAAAKDPKLGDGSSPELADAPDDEISEEFLEPVVDSAPLALPPLPSAASAEPLASAIPTGSVVAPAPSTASKKGWGKVGLVAFAAVAVVALGSFVRRSAPTDGEPRSAGVEKRPEPMPPNEANPALRAPLPPLELDIGVPVGAPAESSTAEPAAVPPVAPSGILPTLPPKVQATPFDEHAAEGALNQAAAAALACRKNGDPSGSATVSVRYAPSGRVTSATVEAGPFAGTVVGGCIATTFRRAIIPPFSGDYVTVRKTVTLK